MYGYCKVKLAFDHSWVPQEVTVCLHSFQSESLVALEAAKAAEKTVLDEQVRSSQETLQEKLKELSALQQQNVKVNRQEIKKNTVKQMLFITTLCISLSCYVCLSVCNEKKCSIYKPTPGSILVPTNPPHRTFYFK